MALIDNDITCIPEEEQSEEDFGFVRRDAKILQKAVADESGSKQVDDDSGSQVGEDGPDAVTSGDLAGDGLSERMRSVSCEEATGQTGRKVGLLKETVQVEKFGAVYDASKVIDGPGDAARDLRPPKTEPRQPRYSIVSGDFPRSSGSSVKRISKVKMSEKPRDDAQDVSLPQSFQVKYLGYRDASGLWGIKHTRKPVDQMVRSAKNLETGTVLPIVRLLVSKEGVSVLPLGRSQEALRFHAIDTISYGVQDLVYTRVFCIIIVRETASGSSAQGRHPFECHAFVCDSRHGARKLTYSLSAAFKEFSKSVKESGDKAAVAAVKKKFAIDLRSPEEIEEDLKGTEDSEA